MTSSSDSMLKTSVVICHHIGNLVDKCLKSVARSNNIELETIVVTDEPKRAFNANSMIRSKAMPAEKRNIGSREATGNFIAYLDDDVEVSKDALRVLLNYCKKPGVGMVFGKLHNMEHTDRFDEAGGYLTWNGFIWSRAGQNDIDVGQYDVTEPVFAGKSALCMIRKDVLYEVEGFDEDFEILGEETDLAWRVWLRGYKVLYVPEANGLHAFNTKFKPAHIYYTSKRVHVNGCRNYTTMLIKNLSTFNLWIIVPIHVICWLIAGLSMILVGKFTQGFNIFKGLFQALLWLPNTLRKRKEIQRSRSVTDRAIWPHIFRSAPRGYYLKRLGRYLQIQLHG